MSSLFIAGNGFDVAHGIPTQYSEFRSFIIQKYPEALELRDEVVCLEDFGKIDPNEFAAEILLNAMDKAAGENWCNFEDALAYINFDNKFPMDDIKTEIEKLHVLNSGRLQPFCFAIEQCLYAILKDKEDELALVAS